MKDQMQRNSKTRQGRASTRVVESQRENNAGKKPGGVTGKGFMPGHSGNPGGRPKGSVKVSSCYERSLARPFPGDPQGRTYAQVIADKAVELAAEGRIDAIKEVTDRTEGRSKQTIDVNRSDLRREYLRRAVDELSAKYGKSREEVVRDIVESEPAASEWLM
jgi:uncharacterized protein DUF5681